MPDLSDTLAAIDAATGCQQCAVGACAKPARSRGWCGAHYERWRKHGDPGGSSAPDQRADGAARLAARSTRSGTCLLYVGGHLNKTGYGRMSFMGRHELVHRISWKLARGPIPEGLFVCHRCDTPNCIEIDHLFLGTAADNNADRDRKGRTVALRGSRNAKAKLQEWQVLEIKQKLAQGCTLHSLADEYGVAVADHRQHQPWAQLATRDPPSHRLKGNPMTEPRQPPADQTWLEVENAMPRGLTFTGKLTDEQLAEFREAFERARLNPQPLLINGQVELRPRRWWQRLWRWR